MHIAALASYEKLVDRQLEVVSAYEREYGVPFLATLNATEAVTETLRREWVNTKPWRE